MATKVQNAPQTNGVPKKPAAPRSATIKRPAANQIAKTPRNPAKSVQQKAQPVSNKAYSVSGGEHAANGVTSAYAIMANRIANRVAEMAESITFVERYVNLSREERCSSS